MSTPKQPRTTTGRNLMLSGRTTRTPMTERPINDIHVSMTHVDKLERLKATHPNAYNLALNLRREQAKKAEGYQRALKAAHEPWGVVDANYLRYCAKRKLLRPTNSVPLRKPYAIELPPIKLRGIRLCASLPAILVWVQCKINPSFKPERTHLDSATLLTSNPIQSY